MRKLIVQSVLLAGCVGLLGCPKSSHDGGPGKTDGGSATAADGGGGSHAGSGASGSSGSAGSAGSAGGSVQKDAGGTAGHAGSGDDAGAGTTHPKLDAGAADGGAATGCTATCPLYQHCELVAVTCIRAPCPPLPTCVDNTHCGGIAARPCPGYGTCQDDPRDSCDPQHGGADCGGVCVCIDTIDCIIGKHWDSTACDCK